MSSILLITIQLCTSILFASMVLYPKDGGADAIYLPIDDPGVTYKEFSETALASILNSSSLLPTTRIKFYGPGHTVPMTKLPEFVSEDTFMADLGIAAVNDEEVRIRYKIIKDPFPNQMLVYKSIPMRERLTAWYSHPFEIEFYFQTTIIANMSHQNSIMKLSSTVFAMRLYFDSTYNLIVSTKYDQLQLTSSRLVIPSSFVLEPGSDVFNHFYLKIMEDQRQIIFNDFEYCKKSRLTGYERHRFKESIMITVSDEYNISCARYRAVNRYVNNFYKNDYIYTNQNMMLKALRYTQIEVEPYNYSCAHGCGCIVS